MSFSFSLNFTRNSAAGSPSQILQRTWGRARRLAAASLCRVWSDVLRMTGVPETSRRLGWPDCMRALAISVLCTAIAWQLPSDFGLVNIVMVYLLGTTLAALRLGRGPIVALAICNMLAFDYFFV